MCTVEGCNKLLGFFHIHISISHFTSVLRQPDLQRKVLRYVGLPVFSCFPVVDDILLSSCRQCLSFEMKFPLLYTSLIVSTHWNIQVIWLFTLSLSLCGPVIKYAFTGTKGSKEFKALVLMGHWAIVVYWYSDFFCPLSQIPQNEKIHTVIHYFFLLRFP